MSNDPSVGSNSVASSNVESAAAASGAQARVGEVSSQAEAPGIPSVNSGPRGAASPVRKLMFIGGALLGVVVLGFGAQAFLTSMKNKATGANAPKNDPGAAAAITNPEGGMFQRKPRALGAAASASVGVAVASPATEGAEAAARQGAVGNVGGFAGASTQGGTGCETIPGAKALRGPDGRIMTTGSGRAICVGADGRVIEVPAIKPAQAGAMGVAGGATSGAQGATAQVAKAPASRFGGALFADGSGGGGPGFGHVGTGSVAGSQSAQQGAQTGQGSSQPGREGDLDQAPSGGPDAGRARVQQAALHAINTITSRAAGGAAAGQQTANAGSPSPQVPFVPASAASAALFGPAGVAALLNGGNVSGGGVAGSDAVSARFVRESSFVLPKARQIDCVLTTRIINEVPGLTSCSITHDLYGSDGKVKLVEKGSVLDGEYGNTTQGGGQRRLFVVWSRLRTPSGVVVNLRSPGTDALGTSGHPGFLEQRWAERIGTALLISGLHDLVALESARIAGRSGTGSVAIQQPMQSTRDATQSIVEQVIRSTMQTRPTLYINEGERVAVYVAQDVDFAGVYKLRVARGELAGAGQ